MQEAKFQIYAAEDGAYIVEETAPAKARHLPESLDAVEARIIERVKALGSPKISIRAAGTDAQKDAIQAMYGRLIANGLKLQAPIILNSVPSKSN